MPRASQAQGISVQTNKNKTWSGIRGDSPDN